VVLALPQAEATLGDWQVVVGSRTVSPQVDNRKVLKEFRLNAEIREALDASGDGEVVDVSASDLVGGESGPPDEVPGASHGGEEGTREVGSAELLQRQRLDHVEELLEGVGAGTGEGEGRADGGGSGVDGVQGGGDVENL
jgi:hypothetical protein